MWSSSRPWLILPKIADLLGSVVNQLYAGECTLSVDQALLDLNINNFVGQYAKDSGTVTL